MLPTVAAVQIAYMLNEPEPRQLGSGSLQDSACHAVLGLDVRQVRHYGISPFQLKEYARGRMLLIAIAGKEHFDKLCEV